MHARERKRNKAYQGRKRKHKRPKINEKQTTGTFLLDTLHE